MACPRAARVRLVLSALLCLTAAGCARLPPTLAGGKPVEFWVRTLREGDPRQRQEAAFKLGNVGRADPAALPALTEALRDPEPKVRREVILALVKFGDGAREVIPALTEIGRTDPDEQVRSHAVRAVERLQRTDASGR